MGRQWMMSAAEVTFLKDPSRTGCMICGAQCSENLESPIQTTNTATVECLTKHGPFRVQGPIWTMSMMSAWDPKLSTELDSWRPRVRSGEVGGGGEGSGESSRLRSGCEVRKRRWLQRSLEKIACCHRRRPAKSGRREESGRRPHVPSKLLPRHFLPLSLSLSLPGGLHGSLGVTFT